jgi:hypothetical protein
MSTQRSLNVIASEIRSDWKSVNYGAKPYLDAMGCLTNVSDNFGMDTGKSIVLYFLSNASTWRGETAKRVKAELKKMVGLK